MKRELPPDISDPNHPGELERLLSLTNEAIVYVDDDWVVQYCNDVYLRNVGLTRQEVVGRTPFEYIPAFRRSIFFESLEQCRRERKPMVRMGFSAVLQRWLMIRVAPAGDGLLMLANEASDNAVREYQLAQQAFTDSLTGLRNKLALVEDMRSLLNADRAFFVAVLELQRLRVLNETHGYTWGDRALLELGSRMQMATAAGESLYRISGEEFAVLIPSAQETAVARVNELLRQAHLPVRPNNQSFVVGAKAAGVEAPLHGTDAEQLLKRASLALHHASTAKVEGVVVYDPVLETGRRLRFELEAELREAIDNRQLTLVVQPKGCLNTGAVVGGEALIRWNHPTRGMVSPAEFLPVAEEVGLMRRIDQWVLQEAIRYLRELVAKQIAVPLAINVSVDSLSDVDFARGVGEALSRSGLSPSLLEIEIPEGALMHDVTASANVLAALEKLGVGIAVDDFGTGYSSFAYLARFPVNTLKVDRSFVKEMESATASRRVVRGLIKLAHSLSLQVVAEGAETDEQIAMLSRMQCDIVQGYGYAKPMPFEAFCSFVRERRAVAVPDAFSI